MGGIFANCLKPLLHAANLVPPATSLGASTAVTATLVVFAFHFPWQRVYVWFVLPMPVWLLVVIFVGLDVLGVLGGGRGGIGHLGGGSSGATTRPDSASAICLRDRPGKPRRVKPQLRMVPPPELDDTDTPEPVGAAVENRPRPREGTDDIESKLDAVLAKVSKFGQESLTPEETRDPVQGQRALQKTAEVTPTPVTACPCTSTPAATVPFLW